VGVNAKKEPDGEYVGEDDNGKNVHEDVRTGDRDGKDDGDASG